MEQFEILIARLTPKLKAIAKQLDGKYSFLDDDDLFQESQIVLWKKHQAGILQDKTDSYILESAKLHLLSYLRRKDLKENSESMDMSIGMDEDGKEEILADTIAEKVFISEQYYSAVLAIEESSFRPREKEILILTLQGFTEEEIGEKLGISHQAVSKTRKKLQGLVAKMSFE